MNGKVLAERAKFCLSRTYKRLIQGKENSIRWLWKILINRELLVLFGDFLEGDGMCPSAFRFLGCSDICGIKYIIVLFMVAGLA